MKKTKQYIPGFNKNRSYLSVFVAEEGAFLQPKTSSQLLNIFYI